MRENDTMSLIAIVQQDSIAEAEYARAARKDFLRERQLYFNGLNERLYKIFSDLDAGGLGGYKGQEPSYRNDTIVTSFSRDFSQLTIVTSGMVHYQAVSSQFNLGNIEKYFPHMWALVKERKLVFDERPEFYRFLPEVSNACCGGLTLPKVPYHLAYMAAGPGKEKDCKALAEEFWDYFVSYSSKNGCNKQLLLDMEEYEKTLSPKTWERRLRARARFVDILHKECNNPSL